ncbi:hypothetical protein [Rhodocaloribacter sp.]
MMAEWSVNHRACTTTYTTLIVLAQLPRDLSFRDAGDVPMSGLAFWKLTSSAQVRRVQAGALALQIDNVFRDIRGAVYEPGVDPDAVPGLIREALLRPENTVADLAALFDGLYLFWRENDAT